VRTALILQARTGSRRLPGKSMLPLVGVPLVGRILERVKRCRRVDAIVLATTEEPGDDRLAALAQEFSVDLFRGSRDDLVDRYYQAARACRADIVVRLPADNPVPEPGEIDRIIDAHHAGDAEFYSNLASVFSSGYPDGIGAEVLTTRTLADVWERCTDPAQREHVHLNFFDYAAQREVDPDRYRVGTIACPPTFRRPDLVLDVNTREQYAFMVHLYRDLYVENPRFHILDVIRWYDGPTPAH
jgi:spore coat polysaccharide biosynthesis protein SpsF